MSSSRVHCMRTGAPIIFDRIAASHTKSDCDLRPKPPPSRVTLHSTSDTSSSIASATYLRVSFGDCTEPQTWTGRALASTSAHIGSIVVWMKYGTKYSDSKVCAASANADSTSPRLRTTTPPLSSVAPARADSRSFSL